MFKEEKITMNLVLGLPSILQYMINHVKSFVDPSANIKNMFNFEEFQTAVTIITAHKGNEEDLQDLARQETKTFFVLQNVDEKKKAGFFLYHMKHEKMMEFLKPANTDVIAFLKTLADYRTRKEEAAYLLSLSEKLKGFIADFPEITKSSVESIP